MSAWSDPVVPAFLLGSARRWGRLLRLPWIRTGSAVLLLVIACGSVLQGFGVF